MVERPVPSVEAEDLMEQVRRRVERETLSPERHAAVRMYGGAIRLGATGPVGKTAVRSGRPTFPGEVAARLGALEESLLFGFERSLLGIGNPPPGPVTVRGYLGRQSIKFLGKLLWWYTRSLMAFGDAVGKQFHDEAALLTAMARTQEEQRAEIAALREEVRQLREGSAASPKAEPS